MIICVDIETEGLDATKYITGCLIREDKPEKPEIYNNKKELWKRIVSLAIKEAKRNRITNVYSHNAQYDTAGYVNLKDKHLRFFCNKPFIWSYRLTKKECENLGIKCNKTEKEIIKFLDTMNIYKMPLKELGEKIKIEKQETPLEILQKPIKTQQELETIQQYMTNDTKIILKTLINLKGQLKDEGIQLKRLYTVNQIGISYLMNKLKQQTQQEQTALFENTKIGKTWKTIYHPEIHNAYRAGRLEAYQLGEHENVNYIDCNSLYPYSISNLIKTPDLRTERKWYNPEEQATQKQILEKIGISKVIIKNNTNKIGLIPVRTTIGNYYIQPQQIAIGTWTNIELQKAIKEGHKIMKFDWTINYKETKNPFKQIYEQLYQKRTKAIHDIDKHFYKMIMNSSIGKMAQHNTGQEIIIDNVEKLVEYLKNQWKVCGTIGYNYKYKKKLRNEIKPYYTPIIPTLVNAYARIYMYEQYKKIKQENILYTDTDSIMWKKQEVKNIPLGKEMGQFKQIHTNTQAYIRGRKSYLIADEVILSGVNKKNRTIQGFKEGKINTQKMITIGTTNKIEEIGKFKQEERNLLKQQQEYEKIKVILKEQKIIKDEKETHINKFIDILQQEEVIL